MIDFAVVEITEKCNLKCSHCYLGEKTARTMSPKQIDIILDRLVNVGCQRITISGGEPFCADDLLSAVIDKAYERKIRIGIVTNGTQLHKCKVSMLERINYIQISLDGLESTHDAIRGNGSFKTTLEGIRYLIENGCEDKTTVQMTVSAVNQYEFFDVYDFIKKLGVKMSVERVSVVGNAHSYKALDFSYYVKILDCIIDNHLLSSDPLVNVRKMQRIGINPRNLPFSGGCSAGKNGLAITVNGDVLPCVRIRKACGNLFKSDLSTIIKSEKFTIYSAPIGKCKRCDFSNACGGCKADCTIGETDFCYL